MSNQPVITREESLPIVKVIIPAGVNQVISFPQQFFGYATDIRISNQDATNNLSYQIGGDGMPTLLLAPSSFVAIGGTRIDLIRIIAGAAGVGQIEASIRYG